MTNELADKLGAVPATKAIEFFNLYLYGDFGAGKTHLGGTAQDSPHTRNLLVLDVEGGTATIRHRADVDVIQVRKMAQMKEIHDAVMADGGKTYKTLMVDSLTELQKLDMKQIMEKAPQVKSGNQDPEVPSPREWGMTLVHMRNIVRAYKDLPCNVIFTALATKTQDDDGNVTYMPSLQGRALFEIPAFFDVVAYLDTTIEKGVVERRLISGGNPKYRAKDRLGIGPPVMFDPTIPKIWDNLTKTEKK